MQDRFKFRYVFQKKFENRKIVTKTIYFNIEDIEHPNFMDGVNELTRKGYVLIARNFCTGLKDKNGKLIFEGDIVSVYNKIYLVIFETRTAYFGLKVSNYETYTLNCIHTLTSSIEVIGNVYETPELLKEVQGEK